MIEKHDTDGWGPIAEVVNRDIRPYSVHIARYRTGSAWEPIGSGIFVERSGRYGILTAHHCLFAPTPTVGTDPGESLSIKTCGEGDPILIPSREVIVRGLAGPSVSGEYSDLGPDLAVIELPSSLPQLGTIAARASAAHLGPNHRKKTAQAFVNADIVAVAGHPHAYARIEGEVRIGEHLTATNASGKCRAFEQDGWDYVECPMTGSWLPPNFKGVSGGGIWVVQLDIDEETEEPSVRNSRLAGIVFYESERDEKGGALRGHGPGSIYLTDWPS